MTATALPSAFKVVIVAEQDELLGLIDDATTRLSGKLRTERSVRSHAKRFGREVAADPSSVRVEILDAVGLCVPSTEEPNVFEPIVVHDGKPVPVSMVYIGMNGDYWMVAAAELATRRDRIVSTLASRVAEELFICAAMAEAVHQADDDCSLTSFSCEAQTMTVSLDDDPDGAIAKRLPAWIKVEDHSVRSPG